eukprot:594624-Rhodomonas_salina.2
MERGVAIRKSERGDALVVSAVSERMRQFFSPFDVIVAVDGHPISASSSVLDVSALLNNIPMGSRAVVTVCRVGREDEGPIDVILPSETQHRGDPYNPSTEGEGAGVLYRSVNSVDDNEGSWLLNPDGSIVFAKDEDFAPQKLREQQATTATTVLHTTAEHREKSPYFFIEPQQQQRDESENVMSPIDEESLPQTPFPGPEMPAMEQEVQSTVDADVGRMRGEVEALHVRLEELLRVQRTEAEEELLG